MNLVVGFDTLSSVAWCANLATIFGFACLCAGRPKLILAIFGAALRALDLLPRVDHSFGYIVTLLHGPGYWSWLAANAGSLVASLTLGQRASFVDPFEVER